MNPYPTATAISAASPTPANGTAKTSKTSSDSLKSATAKPQAHGSSNTFDDLLRQHSGMLHRLALYHSTRWGVDLDDLLQIGRLAILRAAEMHDPAKGANFCTYSAWWMRSRMHRECLEFSRTVRPPLSKRKGEKMKRIEMVHPESFRMEGECDKWEVVDGCSGDGGFGEFIQNEQLPYLLECLNAQERQAIQLHYFNEMTLDEAGELLGVSRERVRQRCADALKKMRAHARLEEALL